MMLTNGIDPKTAAGRLGHVDAVMLMRTYAHVPNSADKAAAQKLESAWAAREK